METLKEYVLVSSSPVLGCLLFMTNQTLHYETTLEQYICIPFMHRYILNMCILICHVVGGK